MMKVNLQFQRPARIEMIPLIDTVFLLLVFFIYAAISMTVHRGIPVDLPAAPSSIVNKEDYLSISVTEEGKVFLNKIEVSLVELPDLLSQEKGRSPEIKVFINADKKAYHGLVIKVLDAVRRSGIRKVSIQAVGEEEW